MSSFNFLLNNFVQNKAMVILTRQKKSPPASKNISFSQTEKKILFQFGRKTNGEILKKKGVKTIQASKFKISKSTTMITFRVRMATVATVMVKMVTARKVHGKRYRRRTVVHRLQNPIVPNRPIPAKLQKNPVYPHHRRVDMFHQHLDSNKCWHPYV